MQHATWWRNTTAANGTGRRRWRRRQVSIVGIRWAPPASCAVALGWTAGLATAQEASRPLQFTKIAPKQASSRTKCTSTPPLRFADTREETRDAISSRRSTAGAGHSPLRAQTPRLASPAGWRAPIKLITAREAAWNDAPCRLVDLSAARPRHAASGPQHAQQHRVRQQPANLATTLRITHCERPLEHNVSLENREQGAAGSSREQRSRGGKQGQRACGRRSEGRAQRRKGGCAEGAKGGRTSGNGEGRGEGERHGGGEAHPSAL